MGSSLLLLDGHSLAYRAFYALPAQSFTTVDGRYTNAVYGFTSMLINLLRDEAPTYAAVAFDVSRTTFRTEMFADYKAHRSASPAEFRGQVELIQDVLTALGIPVMAADGYEADDVIATLATRAQQSGTEVLIVTGDRDALQLVAEDVTVLYPRRGVSNMTRFTPAEVVKKYGLTPAQYPDFAALRGDSSDNLPGIAGVGEKTATKWIQEFGSLSALIDRADEVRGRAGDSLRANLAVVQLNRQLTELIRDMPLDTGPAVVDVDRWDADRIWRLFTTLEFRTLGERLFETLNPGRVHGASSPHAGGQILGSNAVSEWLDEHTRSGRSGLVVASGLGSVAIAAADGSCAQIELAAASAIDEEALAEWFADGTRIKAVHDAKALFHVLRQRGWRISGVTSDTLLAAYLVQPSQRSLALDELSRRYLRREVVIAAVAGDGQLSLLDSLAEDPDSPDGRLMEIARAVADLAVVLDRKLDRMDSRALLSELELPVMWVLAAMEAVGIAVDEAQLEVLDHDFARLVGEAEQAAYAEIGGTQLNLASPKQLQTILFDDLGMPKTKKTKVGYSTDAEALQGLYAATAHPFLKHLLAHRDAAKMRGTVESLRRVVTDEGRIHTTFTQTVTATGRLSSTNPNLQNIPVRTPAGRRIRGGFVAGDDFECLMTADYSQIEMRIMAHLSNDAGLIEAFNLGEDLHNFVGARAFGVTIDEVTPEMRRRVKAMSYGLAYGLSEFGLAAQLGISRDEAQEQMNAYFARFGGVRDYLDGVVAEAGRTGYTATLFGRRRYLPDLNSDVWPRRLAAERMALNAPIQGSAADIIKIAMIRVHTRLNREGLRSRILLQVHDELVLEVAVGERDVVERLVREEMCSAITLSVPLVVSIGVGGSWDAAAH